VERVVGSDSLLLTVLVGAPTVVRIEGELDVAGAPRLTSVLCGLAGDVAVDCSALQFIDAAGLRVFVRIHEVCAERGANFTVIDPSAPVMRLLRLVELDSVLNIRNHSA
jgi:anti-anti-sigma factor